MCRPSTASLPGLNWHARRGTVILGYEQANRYTVLDQDGNTVALLAEDLGGLGKAVGRQLLRTRRSFTATVFSPDGACGAKSGTTISAHVAQHICQCLDASGGTCHALQTTWLAHIELLDGRSSALGHDWAVLLVINMPQMKAALTCCKNALTASCQSGAGSQVIFRVRRPVYLINSTIYVEDGEGNVVGEVRASEHSQAPCSCRYQNLCHAEASACRLQWLRHQPSSLLLHCWCEHSLKKMCGIVGMGQVKQRWHPIKRNYDLYRGRQQFASIEGNFLAWEFVLRDEQGGTP